MSGFLPSTEVFTQASAHTIFGIVAGSHLNFFTYYIFIFQNHSAMGNITQQITPKLCVNHITTCVEGEIHYVMKICNVLNIQYNYYPTAKNYKLVKKKSR